MLLNQSLYQALVDTFNQEPTVCNAGAEGVFSCPPIKRTRLTRSTKRMAKVEYWGETYAINCPVCKDKRKRLYFSHLCMSSTKANNVTYYFGKLYKCQNEGCFLGNYINDLDIGSPVIKTKAKAFTGIILQEAEIPKGCIPLLSPDVPANVIEYIRSRRFDPAELANEYFVHLATKGTTYEMRGEKREFFDDRLIVPLIQGRRLVGWQARRCADFPKDKYKYLNSSVKKSACLYNRDVAMFHRDITIVEGVTDCWRIGPESIAIFGKDTSSSQIELMKLLWGFSGSAVVCFDSDALDSQRLLIKKLRENNVFPRGVSGLELPCGRDPATFSRREIGERIAEARERCH